MPWSILKYVVFLWKFSTCAFFKIKSWILYLWKHNWFTERWPWTYWLYSTSFAIAYWHLYRWPGITATWFISVCRMNIVDRVYYHLTCLVSWVKDYQSMLDLPSTSGFYLVWLYSHSAYHCDDCSYSSIATLGESERHLSMVVFSF